MPIPLKELLIPNHHLRNKFLDLFKSNNLWKPVYGLRLNEERNMALTRLRNLTDNKLIDVKDFKSNPSNIFDAHEYVGYMDGSTSTKMTVQFNLFGGTVLNLGTDKHHGMFLDKINSLENIGCFAFTEKGYGNNAFKMETTAIYNKYDNTFTINSSSHNSHKYWITNSACDANYCVVFAQLIVGEQNHGPHPFLVRVRDNNGNFMENVSIKDMGYKVGLNGVDNGEITFTNFKTDAGSLLDSISQVSDSGVFSSTIESKRKRFLKMADQLVSGRLCISSMMLGCSKVLLNNTVLYATKRYGVGPDGESSMPIINYGIQKSVLAPLLVKTVGLNLGLNRAKYMYSTKDKDLIPLACAIKPMLAWNTQDIVTKCRELTGGEGYLISNQFGEGIAASWAGITAEGDSKVLMMKVASERIKNLGTNDILSNKLSFGVSKFSSTFTKPLVGNNFEKWFLDKEKIILSDIAISTKMNGDYYDVWMKTHHNLVQEAARAYCDTVIYNEFEKACKVNDKMKPLQRYYMLDCISRDALWYCSKGLISSGDFNEIIKEKLQLETYIVSNSDFILDGFDLPHEIINANMAKSV